MAETVQLNKTVYGKITYPNVINTEFTQLLKPQTEVTSSAMTVDQFFQGYNDLFYERIIDKGYIIFDLTNELIKTIDDYNIETLREEFKKNNNTIPLTDGVDKNNNLIQSNYRKAIEFYESEGIKDEFNSNFENIINILHITSNNIS
jgi:hypothetical protein